MLEGGCECEEMRRLRWVLGTSLVVQWLRIHLTNAGDTGSIPGLERSHMLWGN